ncbi:hypothetical protein NEOLI_005093 [Neolecta irregularis DAH-3]|uniref:LysM domain-containing protein n=1 Tax=Neolecta irregularis (strain DAH-3) TaxID=1198029 RepID=A0A1U7LLR5_NEOID|nr:hypothetical protein NEOLI_005093 [Neolecta irregularis DAH-3]|eukprot:OLL23482.1 hypothetical protein NEOLI_005093 [Neolecta irregularis DAH-3]
MKSSSLFLAAFLPAIIAAPGKLFEREGPMRTSSQRICPDNCPQSHTVGYGDTVYIIARDLGILPLSEQTFKECNPRIPDWTAIFLGQQLCFPTQ